MSVSVLTGNIMAVGVASVALTPALVGAATTAEQTFTAPGLRVGDTVCVSKPTAQAGLGIVGGARLRGQHAGHHFRQHHSRWPHDDRGRDLHGLLGAAGRGGRGRGCLISQEKEHS